MGAKNLPNPLDYVTEDESNQPRRPLQIYIGRPEAPIGPNVEPSDIQPTNHLTQSVAPDPQTDLMAGLKELAARIRDRLLGMNDQERYQLWPEKMVRSAVTLPGDVVTGREPVVDPVTGRTSERVIERAQDLSGLAGSATLAARPGVATLGSGPYRKAPMTEQASVKPTLTPEPVSGLDVALPVLEKLAGQRAAPEQWVSAFEKLPEVKNALMLPEFRQAVDQQHGTATGSQVADFLRKVQAFPKEAPKPEAPKPGVTDMDRRTFVRGLVSTVTNAPRILKFVGKTLESMPGPVMKSAMTKPIRLVNPEAAIRYGMSPDHEKKLIKSIQQSLLDSGLEPREALREARRAWQNDPDIYIMGHFDTNKIDFGHRYDPSTKFDVIKNKSIDPNSLKFYKHQLPGGENYREHLLELPTQGVRGRGVYQLLNKNEPNVLANVRMNDRNIRGEKSLHLEEIQSDWLQEGRRKEYKENPNSISWPELALKRMIRYAAKNGYKRVSWTPGEAHVARYDLSKQVNNLRMVELPDGRVNVLAYSKNGDRLKHFSDTELEEHVGYEIAKKLRDQPGIDYKKWSAINNNDGTWTILDNKGNKTSIKPVEYAGVPHTPDTVIRNYLADKGIGRDTVVRELSGLDLKIGGERMREFYDQTLTKMVEELGKAHGVKVQKGELPGAIEVRTPEQVYDILTKKDPKLKDRFPTIKDYVDDYWNGLNSKSRADLIHSAQQYTRAPVWYFDIPPAWRDQAILDYTGGHATSANTLLSDTSQPGTAISALAHTNKPAPVFYSALEHAVENSTQNAAPAQQWLGWLKNQPGVKQEELAWTGLPEWLGAQKGKVSKADVQAYLKEHQVEIKDVTKGGYDPEEAIGDLATQIMRRDHPDVREGTPRWDELFDDAIAEAEGELRGGIGGGGTLSKYSDYQLPGGENYREHLLMLPEKRAKIDEEAYKKLGEANRALTQFSGQMANKYGNGWRSKLNAEDKAQLNRINADIERYAAASGSDEQVRLREYNYQSSHWDEPNVLAHVRTNDRVIGSMPIADIEAKIQAAVPDIKLADMGSGMPDALVKKGVLTPQEAADWSRARRFVTGKGYETGPGTGKKSLHIEEVQSDWHQQGRKQGYKNAKPEDIKIAENKMNEARSFLQDHLQKMGLSGDEVQSALAQARENKIPSWVLGDPKHEHLATDFIDAQRDFHDINKTSGVPDAPFKTSWPELALKRMIRHAAENGYERISWTPGEAQAVRYDLSKHVDKLQYNPDTKKLLAHKGKRLVLEREVPSEKLADYIGKEAADRIINRPTAKLENPNNKGTYNHYLEGEDIKVGGEGMREFYDKMLPKMVEKLGKAHGVKVQKAYPGEVRKNIDGDWVAPGGGEFRTKEAAIAGNKPVWYFDIPPAWRDQAMSKGFPLFVSGIPFPLTPVDYDPFAKKDKK